VISYAYLWRHEHNRGQDEGRKDRPCVVVLAVDRPSGKAARVTVAAITHTPPGSESVSLEVPPSVKRHLGLDEARSWIVLDEVNQFDWPGFDLRPISARDGARAYGFIPPNLYLMAISKLREASKMRKIAIISRD
jgi:mRNA-degrading endonuclease toxin of MazEF toxin-antitoxin module